MIVLDFMSNPSSFEIAAVDMERKLSDKSHPMSPTADPPDTDSARSTPEAGAEATGAIPKSRSTGKLNALRSSLREVGKNSSFKLGRKKQEGGTLEKSQREEKKKSKKIKKKEAAIISPTRTSDKDLIPEASNVATTSPLVSTSSESLPTKASKVSKASSLVRKLSIGRYRDRGKNTQHESPHSKTLSPTSTSPELSPAPSRTDVSDVDDVPSATSSASEGRQGPEGEDVARPPSAGERLAPLEPASPPRSPPRSPPPSATLGQSRLIGGGVYKGLADQSEPPSSRGSTASAGTTDRATLVIASIRQQPESSAPRRDRDPALETVPEGRADEESWTPQPLPLETERSPPSTLAFQSAFTSLEESFAPGSSKVLSAAFMSQRLGVNAADATSTKSQILSITTPALKKQQALEEIRAAAVAAAATSDAKLTATARPLPSSPPPPEEPEDEQFGDVEEEEEEDDVTSGTPSTHAPMSAPPPSAATVMAEARARLSQSLGSSSDVAAQPVNEKREHLYKILVIGELGTGKTSIIKRYVHQFFSQHYRATIGVDFALKVLNWDANTVIRLQLWDIAGQERFGNMTRVYYKEAVGAFIVFDVTRAATFDAVIKWKQDLDAKVQLADGSPIPCVLLANKCDQQKEGIVNNTAKMDEYCREKGFSAWFETSAKENINIEDAARCLVTKILQNDKLIHNDNGKDNDKFALDGKAQKDEKSGGKSCAC